MKKMKVILCLIVAVITVFAFTACGGGTFDGNFKKEATAEEIKSVTADAKQATGENGTDAITAEVNKIIKSNVKLDVSYTEDGETIAIKIDSVQKTGITSENKVQFLSENKLSINDKSLEMNVYGTDGDIYIKIDEEKFKIGTALSGSLGIDFNKLTESVNGIDYLNEPLNELLAFSGEQLSEAGVKVYIDQSEKFTKIKYSVSAKALAQMGSEEEANISLNDYYIIVVLDADKKLYGIKVLCDFVISDGTDSMSMKLEGSVEKSDEKIKFRSFEGYEEATAQSMENVSDKLSEFFKAL